MTNIHYKVGCEGVDWEQMRQILIDDDFDNGRTVEQYRISFENTHTVIIAYDGDKIIGTVRALSDGVCNAYIVDVWTYTAYRKQGIARKMMEMAFERLPGQHVYLFTDDDDGKAFYERIGMEMRGIGFQHLHGEWLQNETRDL